MLAVLLLAQFCSGLGSMPWDGWSWAVPQAPIEYFFRRHQNMPVKSPNHQCECPPHKECELEYKINEDAPDFLKLRGLLKEEELKEIKTIIQTQKTKTGMNKAQKRSRRQNEELGRDCCCPPRSMQMPTFITDKKFEEVANRLQNKVLVEQ